MLRNIKKCSFATFFLFTILFLYDILNSSQKAKYQAVDTAIGSAEIYHVSTLNPIIAAKNNEGNVGIITFGANGPAGLISFKDDENGGKTKKISYLKDYFYVERENNNYLYEKSGKQVASSKFTIIDYLNDYLLVKDSKFNVYDTKEGKILSEGFDHIELFNDFYLGIKGKKLNVYNYDDKKTGLIEEELEVTSSDITKGYKVTVHSDSVVISIVATDNATVDYKYNKMDWSKVE